MKKLMIFIVLGLFFVSFASAAEFDNSLKYKNNDMVVTLVNNNFLRLGELFGYAKDLGTMELKSHKSVDHVLEVGSGERVVMYYESNFTEEYLNGLGKVFFTDMRTGKNIERNYTFVYQDTEEYKVIVSFNNVTGTNETKTYERKVWKDLTNNHIPKGIKVIGVKTDVQLGDWIDVVWTIGGKKVSKHAQFIELLTLFQDDNPGGSVTTSEGIRVNVTFNNTLVNVSKQTGSSATKCHLHLATGASSGSLIASSDITSGNTTDTFPSNATMNTTSEYFITCDNGGSSYTRTYYTAGSPQWWPVAGVHITGIKSIIVESAAFDDWIPNLFSVYTINGTIPPTISLDAPANGATVLVPGVIFNATAQDDVGIQNMSLYINESLQLTNSSPFNNTLTQFSNTFSSPGFFNWTVEVCDTDANCVNATSRNITYVNALDITLDDPVNEFNSTSQTIVFNGTGVDDVSVVNMSFILNATFNGTNSSVFNNTLTQFSRTLADGFYNWTMQVCDAVSCLNASTRNFTIDSTGPSVNITFPIELQDYHNLGQAETLNWTATDANLDTCFFQYNGTNTTVTCSTNTTTVALQPGVTNVTFWANDTFGNLAADIENFIFRIFEDARTIPTNLFETDTVSYVVNTTSNSSLTSAIFNWNGTAFGTSQTGTNFTSTISVPTGTGPKEFFWNFTYNGTFIQSNSTNQTALNATLTLCDATNDLPFINISFRNETIAQENITATISSTWEYFLGNGSAFKTLNLANATENLNYTLCFTAVNETVTANYSVNYANSISQQRSFETSQLLTNLTTQQILFLLPTSLGLFQAFATIDSVANVVPNVGAIISRTILGVPTVITSGTTDSSGFISFFLDPTATYDAVFSKVGFEDNEFSFFPSSTARNVIMGVGGVTNATGSNISEGVTWEILPSNTSLNNNTNVTFSFNVTGNSEITLISMNITNTSLTQFLFVNNSGVGFISGILDTGTNTTFIGRFIIQTANETITLQRVWFIGPTFVGDYSIFRQFTLFTTYGFSDFIRLLMVLISIMGVLLFMTSTEVIDTGESKIIVALLMVWGFSIVGWLDTGLATTSILSQFSNQYGIAILGTAGGVFFIFRRIFIRRI